MKHIKKILVVVVAGLACFLFQSMAQDSAETRQGPPPGRRNHPKPPIETALDANGDGVIDTDEITNAPATLKTLDKNGDGKLTADEFRPARPSPRS